MEYDGLRITDYTALQKENFNVSMGMGIILAVLVQNGLGDERDHTSEQP